MRTNVFVAATVPVAKRSTRFSSSVTQATSPNEATTSLVTMNWLRPGPAKIRRHDSSINGQPRRIGQPGWMQTLCGAVVPDRRHGVEVARFVGVVERLVGGEDRIHWPAP